MKFYSKQSPNLTMHTQFISIIGFQLILNQIILVILRNIEGMSSIFMIFHFDKYLGVFDNVTKNGYLFTFNGTIGQLSLYFQPRGLTEKQEVIQHFMFKRFWKSCQRFNIMTFHIKTFFDLQYIQGMEGPKQISKGHGHLTEVVVI